MHRQTVYYQPRPRKPRPLNEKLVAAIKATIEMQPAWGIRMTWAWLRETKGWKKLNIKAVARIMRIKRWTVHKRKKGNRPRVKVKRSQTKKPDTRWSTDLALVFCGAQDGWCSFVPVVDCCTRELLGWELDHTGRAKTAQRALEGALLKRFGTTRGAPKGLMLRHDNGLVFGSKLYRATAKDYGLTQEFITPYTPEENGLCERLIRTVKQECVWQHRFTSLEQARRVIGKWIKHYNVERPHSSLKYKTPAGFHAALARGRAA